MLNRVSTDKIIGTGLVLALLLAITLGTGSDLTQTIASGLVGFLGRTALDREEEMKHDKL